MSTHCFTLINIGIAKHSVDFKTKDATEIGVIHSLRKHTQNKHANERAKSTAQLILVKSCVLGAPTTNAVTTIE